MFPQCHMLNVLLKACARTYINIPCQSHLTHSPLLNSKWFFSWVGAESTNAKAERGINHKEKLAQRITLYK